MMTRYTWKTLLIELAIVLCALVFLYPLYLVILNSFKSFPEIMLRSANWPKAFILSNYERAWGATDFPRVFGNSALVTVFSNAGIVLLSSTSAWRLARRPGKASQLILLLFVSSMVIPFQSLMIPLMQVGGGLDLIGSLWGLIVLYLGLGVAFTVFLYHGFVKSIPAEVEESAIIDGCGIQGLFWRIVFPLLKPITMTAIILNSLWIWNDFLLPSMVIRDKLNFTIPLALYSFFAQYSHQWDLALATLVMSMTPIVVLFLFLQRYVIRGITAGSVKG
ncbi:carbohydrate ABC transporter permease [Paenibacillus hexagrammi]|uniref:Carbohydrate ABC transporter permease n=1 Tax=Paenibacillus hexagrammi TaxID=2908839 RepID=A0ABY3SKE6_9BACL|nr:carbohydrate ABC transporter permease [Paenibacillus sp. YPD9-1]UJF33995.1 carbohydrate ABC transporter permease [Paenibacillus sp. YPD9-1]